MVLQEIRVVIGDEEVSLGKLKTEKYHDVMLQ